MSTQELINPPLQKTREMKKVGSKDSISTIASGSGVYKKYTKINEAIKADFLDKIINHNCSIKKAAEDLNINYSSAKTIISIYRDKTKRKFRGDNATDNRASFRVVDSSEEGLEMECLTSIGGADISSKVLYVSSRSRMIKKIKVTAIIKPELGGFENK